LRGAEELFRHVHADRLTAGAAITRGNLLAGVDDRFHPRL
jgi:hypothetical protein